MGSVTDAVRAAIDSISGDLDEMDWARAAIAVSLAEKLDDGAGMATPGVAKELRELLTAITPEVDDGANDPVDEFLAGLRSPVRHTAN